MDIGYNKLTESAKEFLAQNHNVPQAQTFAEGPFVEGKIPSIDDISVFKANGELAVGDPEAYKALQSLLNNQIQKKDSAEENRILSVFNTVNCQPAPEMGC